MSTYGSLVNALVHSLPFANIYQSPSINGSHEALLAGPVVIGIVTTAPMMASHDVLATLTMVSTAAVSPGFLYSTPTPQSSDSPNPTVQNSPTETLPEGVSYFPSSEDGIITPAPAPSDDGATTIVFIDSVPPKITIETVRTSTAEATTTPLGRSR
ncbi:hypothetical protein F5Y09DRAFT_340591 [Xylaria sp. FL1042]|nr:hypothetical protein F5Y09DRAFT_340591 [Xylaria sp. FL1042]